MRIEMVSKRMPIGARRVFRLSTTVALSMVAAYAIRVDLPYLAPIFALILTASPSPPMKLKGLSGLVLLVVFTAGTGLLMITVLRNYPVAGLLIVALGLFLSSWLTVNKGKGAVGAFLTVGLTLITAAGIGSFMLALSIAKALVLCIGLAVICQNIVYPFFPEDPAADRAGGKKGPRDEPSAWIAIRATLIVFPSFILALINPSLYLPIIMKSVSLGQQSEAIHAENAGRELIGSTFMGGLFAILFWLALGIETSLWAFFLLMLLFGVYFSSKLYRLIATGYPPSFWINVVITMLILLGPAVQDSAGGKDVYKAMAVRLVLFILTTLYAWIAFLVLEHLRSRRIHRSLSSLPSRGMT